MTVKATDSDDKIQRYRIKEEAQWVSTWRHLALNRRFYWGLGAALDQEKDREVDDGTTWVPLDRLEAAAESWVFVTHDITPHRHAALRVRLVARADLADEDLGVDDLVLTGFRACP